MLNTRQAALVIVEDSDEDFEILKLAFEESGFDKAILRFDDGQKFLDYLLNTCSDYEEQVYPALIILDLNLPETDGREVLSEIRKNPALQGLPIVVLSTSNNPKDVKFCYDHHVSSYSIKPVDYQKLVEFVKVFSAYWFNHSILPEVL